MQQLTVYGGASLGPDRGSEKVRPPGSQEKHQMVVISLASPNVVSVALALALTSFFLGFLIGVGL